MGWDSERVKFDKCRIRMSQYQMLLEIEDEEKLLDSLIVIECSNDTDYVGIVQRKNLSPSVIYKACKVLVH